MTDSDKWIRGNNNLGNIARRVPFTIIDAKHISLCWLRKNRESSYQQQKSPTMTKTAIQARKMVCASLCKCRKRYVLCNDLKENGHYISHYILFLFHWKMDIISRLVTCGFETFKQTEIE